MPKGDVDGRLVYINEVPLSPGVVKANYTVLAVAVLALYEYLLTLDSEIQHIWRRPFTSASGFFLLNRYLCIVFAIPLGMLPPSYPEYVYIAQVILSSLLSMTLGAFFALRTYAIWNRTRWVLCVTSTAYLLPISLNLYVMVADGIPTPTGILSKETLCEVVSISLIVFDSLILVLSLVKLLPIASESLNRDNQDRSKSIYTILLEHGMLHFCLLLVLNIVQAIMEARTRQPYNSGAVQVVSVFAEPADQCCAPSGPSVPSPTHITRNLGEPALGALLYGL
ncbi:hypothetical protein BC835DRAFT_1422103 [Cytidiella melzeri]|nr:hypothetical protein BC835DRAFT_1422103 [Cytidiella melzeri]